MLFKIILECEREHRHDNCAHGKQPGTSDHEKCMVRNAGNCPWHILHPSEPFDLDDLDEIPGDTWDSRPD
jgi:hypothetical protein